MSLRSGPRIVRSDKVADKGADKVAKTIVAKNVAKDAGTKAVVDDASMFLEAMRGARALSGPKVVAPDVGGKTRATPGGSARRQGALSGPSVTSDATLSGSASASIQPEEDGLAAGAAWEIRAEGVDRRAMKRLRDGDLSIDARLDLHGLTRAKAEAALDRFLAGARSAQRRGLLIIHGRGLHSGPDGPTLLLLVRAALRKGSHAASVLAATSAPVALGGEGATVVWLRRT